VTQVDYLGYVIGGEGVSTDPSKISAIVAWPEPNTVTELRGFLGLCGYHRRFIKDFGVIYRPLHDLLKKDAFCWTPLQSEAFNTLKQRLSSAPVLAMPDFSHPFTLETDASGKGIEAVLMQRARPIAFFSQSLGPKGTAQSVYHKEAIAILEALKKWRHYFLGSELIIKTDHQSLKYMMNQRISEGVQHKLMLKLLEFNYTIEYKKGKENIVADSLSRHPSSCVAISVLKPSWTQDIENTYANDTHYQKLLQELVVSTDNANSDYTLTAGIIRYKGRIFIGNSSDVKSKIMQAMHSSSIGGHSGISATYHRIKKIFFWPNIKKSIEEFVSACPVCQRAKGQNCKYPGILHPLPIPDLAWSQLPMDFV
jgi:hypothetical protein